MFNGQVECVAVCVGWGQEWRWGKEMSQRWGKVRMFGVNTLSLICLLMLGNLKIEFKRSPILLFASCNARVPLDKERQCSTILYILVE